MAFLQIARAALFCGLVAACSAFTLASVPCKLSAQQLRTMVKGAEFGEEVMTADASAGEPPVTPDISAKQVEIASLLAEETVEQASSKTEQGMSEKQKEIARLKAAEKFVVKETGTHQCRVCGYLYDETQQGTSFSERESIVQSR